MGQITTFLDFLKEIYGIKIILSLRGSHINYSPLTDKHLAKQYNLYFPKVDKIHSVSKNLIFKAEKFGANKEKIENISSAVDLNLLKNLKKPIMLPIGHFVFYLLVAFIG